MSANFAKKYFYATFCFIRYYSCTCRSCAFLVADKSLTSLKIAGFYSYFKITKNLCFKIKIFQIKIHILREFIF